MTDPEVEQLLSRGLATRPANTETLERMRTAVSQAWKAAPNLAQSPATVESPRAGSRWALWGGLAIAASLVALSVTLLAIRPVVDRQIVGSLARSIDAGVEISQGFARARGLGAGDPLRVGDTLKVRGPILVALAQGGSLRAAPDTVMTVASDTQITLERGLIYLDKPPARGETRPMRIATRSGLIEHLGTEFEVMSDDHAVRIRVREGQVRFSGASGALVANAGTELLSSRAGAIAERPIQTYGRDWLWIAELTPNFAVEGRSLMDYLEWVSRELGRPLVFANDQARDSARRTILHGSAQNQASLDALADVLSTTTLSYELAEGAIRVHSN